MNFFTSLNFSSSNEDGATEIAALAKARRIVCLTGTGTRVLDLLLSEADELIALDFNPAQNALLALKIAAIETFDYADCLAFIGILPSTCRENHYASIRDLLAPEARGYWDNNARAIKGGIWHAGKWEKLLRWNARFQSLFKAHALRQLMDAASVEQQAEIWRQNFVPGRWQNRIEMIGRDLVWRLVMREPASAFLPSATEIAQRLQDDFERASRSFLFRDSDIATLVLRGSHVNSTALPVHLRPENYDRVRSNLAKIRLVEGSLADLATLGIGPCDGFSLSDFGSYCGADDYASCWNGIIATATRQARYCERIFMNEMPLPSSQVSIDPSLSNKLSASDKSIIYRIRAGVIGSAAS